MERDTIMVSIIIPHFESYEMLKRLLDSIGNHKDIQTIVVDDCSSEDVKSLLGKAYSFVEFYRAEKNGGAGYCRNIGLKYAVGKWLLFADADDYFAGDFYAKIKKYFDVENDIIYFAPTSVYEDTGEIAGRHIQNEKLILNYINSSTKTTENNLKYGFLAPWSKLISNTMVQKNQIRFEEVRVSNDVMFSVRCGYYANSIVADRQIIYWITRGRGTLTTKRDFANMYIRLEEYIKSYLFLKERIPRRELRRLEWCGGRYLGIAILNRYSIKEFFKLIVLIFKNRFPIGYKYFISRSISAIKKEMAIKKYK